VIVFDDRVGGPTHADVLINGAVGAKADDYRSCSGGTLFLLGPDYAVLQPAFRCSPERPTAGAATRVLIAVGGADPHGLLPQLVEWIDDLAASFEIAAVVGPFSARPSGSRAYRHRTRLLDAPGGLHDLLASSDLVVCGAGQTLYEAAASGTPAVAIQLFDNQAPTYDGFVAAGAAAGAGAVGAGDLRERVIERARGLLHDAAAGAAMGNAGRRLVDGRGAERVADRLLIER
jgi:spore coat polysaccharide biosynthesis predicted glycosyltransferase SpsG